MSNKKFSPISSENEEPLSFLCEKLKHRNMKTVWTPMFQRTTTSIQENVHQVDFCDTLDIMEFSDEDSCATGKEVLKSAVILGNDRFKNDVVVATGKQKEIVEQRLDFYISEEEVVKLTDLLVSTHEEQHLVEHYAKFEILHSIPTNFIPSLCQRLDIANVEDIVVVQMLHYVCQMNPPVCLSTVSALIRDALCPKIMNMNASSSRSFTSLVLKLLEIHCTAVIEEIFVPCLENGSLGSLQRELLTQILKSTAIDDTIFTHLRKCFQVVKPCENFFTLLLCLIGKKGFYDEHFCNAFIWKLKDWSDLHSTDVKFTKLIIAVISGYGNKVSNEQLSVLKDIVAKNGTFMKKAAENALNKCNK